MNIKSVLAGIGACAIVASIFYTSALIAQVRQQHLYIDDGFGNFSILTGASGGGSFTFPTSGGMVLTSGSSSSITSLGIIASGMWESNTPVAPAYGGTGNTSYTAGDMLYASGSSAFSKLSVATNPDGYVLTLSSGLPVWKIASGGGSGWGLSGNSLAGTEVLGSTNGEPLVLETNGTERMRVLSTGDIGIGTTTPGQSLEIKDGALLLSNSGTAQQLQLQGTGSGVSTLQAGGQGSTAINYMLPTMQPTANQVLTATAVSGTGPYSVTMGWTSNVLFAMKTATQDFKSTALAADNQLSVALVANATYTFDAFLSCIDSLQNGAYGKIGLTLPSGATAVYGVNDAVGYFTATPSAGSGSATITQLNLENHSLNDQTYIEVKGIIVNSGNPGNLQLKFGIVTAGTGIAMIVAQNSYLTAVRVQ